ncbi:sensor histidine kinase N-terminal domain-containing protein [Acidovorax sp. LjRoot118]|uniref:sensor histidine kinase n=1 Tax=Acidovorax sp. LjRoot118 TaxID=3342256 RepID=UPI003ED12E6C
MAQTTPSSTAPSSPWARLRRTSLWRLLALLLLPVLTLVTCVELWMTRHDALEAANAAYDRSLLGALKSIDANISTASGGLSAELPYTMLEFFELTASGHVYFRVASSDGLVELGNADLPLPPGTLEPGVPRFYDATYFGESVRLAAYRRMVDATDGAIPATADGPGSVLVLVAESTQSRQEFTRRFVQRAALRDGLVLALMLLGAAATLAVALRPLSRLARGVQERSPDDMTPIADTDLPADIRPLVAAVNEQMARTQALVAQQRQFLDDASHQLRTHLTTLQMQIDYARREPDPAQVQDALAAIGGEIARATRSTQQLLALGRSDTAAVEFAPFDLAALLRTVALELLPQARAKQIDFGIHTPTPEFTAVADSGLLREALTNLAANAIAYTPAHGTITLSAAGDALGWSVNVEDNGPGMAPEERAALGQRYRRGSQAAAGGSGLGLAIARSIAERHRGALRLEARVDSPGLLAILWWPKP